MKEKVKTYLEPAQEIPVIDQADVVVVGGGPGGHSAAIAAARMGAKVIILERYGYFGGMSTGALVCQLPQLSAGTKDIQFKGLVTEWIDRLEERHSAFHPDYNDLGSTNPELIKKWKARGPFYVSPEGNLKLTVFFDPEMLKCILNEMILENKVKAYLHSWGTKCIVEDGKVKGVVFESKSGRQAILADVVIDATGDADLLPSAGAECTTDIEIHLRMRNMAIPFQIGGIDNKKFSDFKKENPAEFKELLNNAFCEGSFSVNNVMSGMYNGTVAWVNNFIPGMGNPRLASHKVEDLTLVEQSTRRRIMKTIDFYRENVPGFENAFIMRSASQIGIRGGRRLVGEYTLLEMDVHNGRTFDDTIIVSTHFEHTISPEFPLRSIPYRCLVPKKVNGLLVAGRSWSAQDRVSDEHINMAHCILFGQAAGTAAAQAVRKGVEVRDIDYKELQDSLRKQGCYLPDNDYINTVNGKSPAKAAERREEKAKG